MPILRRWFWSGLTLVGGVAVSLLLTFNYGLPRYRYRTVNEMDSILKSGQLIGFSPTQVARFLDSRGIKYILSDGSSNVRAREGECPVHLTARVDPASISVLARTDIAVFFDFAVDCQLRSYDIKERSILP